MTRRGTNESKNIWQILTLALALVFSGATLAQEAAEEGDEAADLDKIAVTGSRIKRTDLEGPAPIIIIDQQQMAERGYTTVYEALSDLTINNGFKFEGAEAALFTPDVQTINLRGFGVGNTLTLINGRRLANYPAAYQASNTVFSYGAIPVAAIERIEILATGASAIYGSDAVAGVINIILRQDIDETTVNALWGTPTETHSTRGDLRFQLVNGKTFDRGSYTLTAEYSNRSSITGADYDQYDNEQDDYPYGQGVYNRTILLLDQFKSAFGIFPRYRDPAEIFGTSGQAACDQSDAGLVYAFRPGAGYFCGDPNQGSASINFQNEKESFSIYFNGKLEIGDGGTEVFTDLMYYNSNSKSANGFIFISEDVLDLTADDTIDFGFNDWYLTQILYNEDMVGMDLDEKFDDQAYTAVLGIRGVFGETTDWELSANYSSAKYDSARPWLKWRETIDNMLGAWLGTSFFGDDWWSGGSLPGENLSNGIGIPANVYGPTNAGLQEAVGIQSYSNKTTDLFIQYTMSGDLWEMPAGPISYAFVAEYEDETLKFFPDALTLQSPPTTDAYGDPISGLTGSGWYRLTGYTGDGDRQRWSVGGELRFPLLDTLTLNVAGRYDDYDGQSTSFGGDFTPSFSMEYRPIRSLLLRGGYTSSFAAPDMAQVYVQTGVFTAGFDYVQCQEQYEFVNGTTDGFDTADCDSGSIFAQLVGAQTFGEPPLDAETGNSWWLGFSWDITDDLSLTVDYTNMTLDQRVNQQSIQGLLNDDYSCYIGEAPTNTPCDVVDKQVIRGLDPLSGVSFIENFYFTSINQFEDKGEYIDVGLTYNLVTEFGIFNFQGDYNNVLSHTRKLTPESATQNLKSDPITGGWDPRSSFAGTISWSYRDFSAALTGIYRGSTTVFNCTTANGGCVGNVTGENYYETENWWVDSYTTFNLTATYNWTDQFLSRLRIVNLFDESPPWDDTMQFFDEPWYNIFVYPGSGIGRYAALELEYTF